MPTNEGETTLERFQREHYGYVERLESDLKAAKQRELELLAVIEKMKTALTELSMNIAEYRTEEFHNLTNLDPSQALREHEAKVLTDASDEIGKSFGVAPLVNGTYQSGFVACHRDCIDALRRMTEERRKK